MRSSEVWWKLPILSLQDNWACEMDLDKGAREGKEWRDSRFVRYPSAGCLRRPRWVREGTEPGAAASACRAMVWHTSRGARRPSALAANLELVSARCVSMAYCSLNLRGV